MLQLQGSNVSQVYFPPNGAANFSICSGLLERWSSLVEVMNVPSPLLLVQLNQMPCTLCVYVPSSLLASCFVAPIASLSVCLRGLAVSGPFILGTRTLLPGYVVNRTNWVGKSSVVYRFLC